MHRRGPKSGKNSSGKGKGKGQGTAAAASKGKAAASADDLVRQGEVALGRLEPELACKFFTAALSKRPTDTAIMDQLADVQLQLGDNASALALLLRSTAAAPTDNPLKWLNLAQLKQGKEALAAYRQGIQLLEASAASVDAAGGSVVSTSAASSSSAVASPSASDAIKNQICRANCSVAELYMTDLCFDEDAETCCEAAVQQALKLVPTSVDALQALVSLRISQCRLEEAAEICGGLGRKVLQTREEYLKRSVLADMSGARGGTASAAAMEEGVDDGEQQDSTADVPTCEFGMATAKLLLECSAVNCELATLAKTLVENLLAEDDEIIELWYLLGLVNVSLAPVPDNAGAVEAFETAKGLMEDVKQGMEEEARWAGAGAGGGGGGMEFPYAVQLKMVEEQLAGLYAAGVTAGSGRDSSAGVTAGAGAGAGANNNDGEDEEWSDDEESGGAAAQSTAEPDSSGAGAMDM